MNWFAGYLTGAISAALIVYTFYDKIHVWLT